MKILIRTQFNRGRKDSRLPISDFQKSLTQQSAQDETDINKIMKRFHQTGVMPLARHQITAQYGDFSNVDSYQSAMNTIIHAQNNFLTLPASIRKQFDNDPHKFLTFMEDPQNKEEAIKLGLLQPDPPAETTAPDKGDETPEPSSTDTPPKATEIPTPDA